MKKLLSVILAAVMLIGSASVAEKATGKSIVSVSASAASYSTGTYKVTHSKGVNVRNKASTSNSKVVGAAAKGVTFTVSQIKTSGGYTWGYTSSIKCTNGTKSGWVVLSYCTATTPTVSFSSMSFPTSITQGNGQHISGTIKSTNAAITNITATVTNSSGKNALDPVTVKPNNTYSYNLYNSTVDTKLTFGKLSAGTYKLTYTVTAGGVTKTYSHSFTVKAKSVPDTTTTAKTETPTITSTSSSSTTTTTNISYDTFASNLYSIAQSHKGNDYKTYGGGSGTHWCGYCARYILISAIKQTYGYSDAQAKKYLGSEVYNAMTATGVLLKYVNNNTYGKYYSFAKWTILGTALTKDYTNKTYTPKVGCIAITDTNKNLIYKNSNGKIDGADHITLIIKVDSDGSFWTVEGNTGGYNPNTTKVKIYKYVKVSKTFEGTGSQTLTTWQRSDCTGGSYCYVVGICEPAFLSSLS